MMKEKMLRWWNAHLQSGMQPNMSNLQRVRLKILNGLSFGVAIFLALILILEMCQSDWFTVSFATLIFGVHLVSMFIVKYRSPTMAYLINNTVHPIIIFGLLLLTGTNAGLEYVFFIYILSSIFSFTRIWLKVVFTSFNALLFISAKVFLYSSGPILTNRPDFNVSIEIMCFLITGFTLAGLMIMLLLEIRRYESKTEHLVRDLRINNQQLTQALHDLEGFTFAASHDLKTPLRSIISFLGLIQKRADPEWQARVEPYLQYVEDSALRMNDLVEEILLYNKLTHDLKGKKEVVDLNSVIDHLDEVLSAAMPEQDVQIFRGELPLFNANRNSLKTLLYNLMENALKYNERDRKVIRIDHQCTENAILLTVKDNGIGIERQYHQKIFMMFNRLHNYTEYPGVGLGLANCKKIMTNLKGQIWLDSTPGQGSTFHLEFPLDVLSCYSEQDHPPVHV